MADETKGEAVKEARRELEAAQAAIARAEKVIEDEQCALATIESEIAGQEAQARSAGPRETKIFSQVAQELAVAKLRRERVQERIAAGQATLGAAAASASVAETRLRRAEHEQALHHLEELDAALHQTVNELGIKAGDLLEEYSQLWNEASASADILKAARPPASPWVEQGSIWERIERAGLTRRSKRDRDRTEAEAGEQLERFLERTAMPEVAPTDAPQYLVAVFPGAPIPGIGFIAQGKSFVAPSPEYVPATSFRPLNRAAQVELEKLGVKRPIFASSKTAAKPKPKVEPGVTLQELGEMTLREQRERSVRPGLIAPDDTRSI